MIGVGILGTAALLIVVGLGLWQAHAPQRATMGAIVLGALSLLTLIAFWSGAPGVLGAGAAGLAGLTRGGRPLGEPPEGRARGGVHRPSQHGPVSRWRAPVRHHLTVW